MKKAAFSTCHISLHCGLVRECADNVSYKNRFSTEPIKLRHVKNFDLPIKVTIQMQKAVDFVIVMTVWNVNNVFSIDLMNIH